jgi:hypothetical protein
MRLLISFTRNAMLEESGNFFMGMFRPFSHFSKCRSLTISTSTAYPWKFTEFEMDSCRRPPVKRAQGTSITSMSFWSHTHTRTHSLLLW